MQTSFTAELLASHPSVQPQLSDDLARVESIIRARLESDVSLIATIGEYIVAAGGKRVRPLLLLLCANALGVRGDVKHELAATVEFIHTATLLHDDVVDESDLRRGRQTANALFGNAASVLVGDFLYSRAFQMMVSCGSLRALEVLADATNVIARGEVLQLMNTRDLDLQVEEYLRVVRFKTAKLFEASSRLGAVLASAAPAVEEACATYGRSVGTAFQLIDDLLDYSGDPADIGKHVGDDLREGKLTLPLLAALQRGSAEDRGFIRAAIEHGEAPLDEVMAILRRTGALDATREAARAEAQTACDALDALPGSPYREALLNFAVRLVDRSA
ncbi:MAG: polyprenyl synthetase family protein [Ideonella sp.]|nr:polyprenyl synthetase family protein [Ideonella sp.]